MAGGLAALGIRDTADHGVATLTACRPKYSVRSDEIIAAANLSAHEAVAC